MRSKNIIIVLLLFIVVTIACKHDKVFNSTEVDPLVENEIPIVDKEAIYRNQTDKNIMLNSFIIYDYTGEKYLLDISEKDAQSLGVDPGTFRDVQTRIEKINQINVEHQ